MEFFQTVKQIGIFMICAQVILHFKPSAKYEKYLKLLISVMVLVQILLPIINTFSGKSSLDFYVRVEEIQAEIDRSMEQLEIENAINEENILNRTLKEVKSRINNSLETEGIRVTDVEYAEKSDSNKLILYVDDKQNDKNINIQITPINVREQEVMGRAVVTDSSEKAERLQVLYNVVLEDMGIPKEQIEVVWNE